MRSGGMLVVLVLVAICLGVAWSLFTTMVYENKSWSIDIMFSKENIIKTLILLGVAVIITVIWPKNNKKNFS